MKMTWRGLLSFVLSASLVVLATSVLATSNVLAQQPAPNEQQDEQPAEQPADESLVPPPPPIPGSPSDRGADAQSPNSQMPTGSPAGWNLLSRATEQLARGNKRSARGLLEQLAADYPDHPATAVSADALAILTSARTPKTNLSGEEENSGLARAELAFFQTIHGIVLGTELCIMFECDDPQSVVLLLGAGGGAGLGLSLLGTANGITPGHASLLNSGTTWGFANGLLASFALEVDGTDAAGMYAASQLIGLGAGALIWDIAEPTAGEVSMANSGGFWVGFLTFLTHAAAEFEADEKTIQWSVLIGANLGILGGALLSQHQPMSRGRTFVIDSGGVLGFLLGIGTYVLIDPEFESPTAFSVMGMVGTITGLGTAAYLSRDWDEPAEGFSANWSVAPTDGGAMLSVGGSFE
jgi:hypothetical protein